MFTGSLDYFDLSYSYHATWIKICYQYFVEVLVKGSAKFLQVVQSV